MRKFTLPKIAIFVLTLLTGTNLQAQLGTSKWEYNNPKPFGFWGGQISYADDNTALVVGELGGIAKTTDGGGTWQYFAFTTTNGTGEIIRPFFNDVQFVNANLAYAVGEYGVMIKSTNGGINWSVVATPFSSISNYQYSQIHTVCFVSADTGYIGGEGDELTNRATIYKTTDGGATWNPEFEFPAPAFPWYTAAILKIRFSPTGVGYAGGANGLVWKYQNGSWSDYSITPATRYVNMDTTIADTIITDYGEGYIDTSIFDYSDNVFGLDQQYYRAIAIMDDTSIVVGSQNNGAFIRINTSTAQGSYIMLNNGSSYRPEYHLLNSPSIYNAICRNGNNIAAASGYGQVLVSADKGYTWTVNDVYTPGSNEADLSFWGIDISPSGRIGVCGERGVIADSTTSWRKPYSFFKKPAGGFFGGGYSLSSISFIDANHGIAGGSNGALIRTGDGGDNWEDVSLAGFNSWDRFTSIVYPSVNTIIASATNGQLYKSIDRGSAFDLLFIEPTNASLDGMDFIGEDTGWVLANVRYPDNVNFIDTFHQFIYRTTDGGSTWDTSSTVFPYPTDYSLRDQLKVVKFLNGTVGYAGGDNGGLYKSIDGGLTWTKMIIPVYASDKPITCIEIVDENVVYVTGERNFMTGGGLVMKTVNGGNTWTMCNNGLPLQANYPKILMYNANEGLLFSFAVSYVTKDGGASWTPYYSNLGGFLAGDFTGASFVPVPGCTDGICQKVFAVAGTNIMKLDADVVLPVKMSKLTGTGTLEGNQLFWTAFAQESVNWFEIERSTDGVHFQKTGNKLQPSSFVSQSYQWLDADAPDGRNYYRVKATERTGVTYYSNIIMLSSKKPAKWAYGLSNDNLILNNSKVEKGTVTATLMNAAGQVMTAKNWNHNGGAFNQAMQLPVNAKGIYMVKVDNAGATTVFRIFIQ